MVGGDVVESMAHPSVLSRGIVSPSITTLMICLTDGVPRDPKLWPERFHSREAYARVRKREFDAALEVGGVARVAPNSAA